jgi:hypothetical protein
MEKALVRAGIDETPDVVTVVPVEERHVEQRQHDVTLRVNVVRIYLVSKLHGREEEAGDDLYNLRIVSRLSRALSDERSGRRRARLL